MASILQKLPTKTYKKAHSFRLKSSKYQSDEDGDYSSGPAASHTAKHKAMDVQSESEIPSSTVHVSAKFVFYCLLTTCEQSKAGPPCGKKKKA
jgi:hypothetical protein